MINCFHSTPMGCTLNGSPIKNPGFTRACNHEIPSGCRLCALPIKNPGFTRACTHPISLGCRLCALSIKKPGFTRATIVDRLRRKLQSQTSLSPCFRASVPACLQIPCSQLYALCSKLYALSSKLYALCSKLPAISSAASFSTPTSSPCAMPFFSQ
jgi:hypothetical protein